MRLYAVTMVVHILGVVALFGSFILLNRVGPKLRASTRYEDARPWAELLFTMRSMMPAGAIMLLLSGGYLGSRLAGQPLVWMAVAAVAVLLIAVVAFAVVMPYLGAVHRLVATGHGPLDAGAARAIARPRVRSAIAAANGAALGTLWLMTAKPGLLESVLVVGTLTAAGAVLGARGPRQATPEAM